MSHPVTVGDLIDKLEEYGRDVEVRIVHQQSWPLQEVIGGIYDDTGNGCRFDEDGCGYAAGASLHNRNSEDYDHDYEPGKGRAVLYLVANGHPDEGSPYGERRAWDDMEPIR